MSNSHASSIGSVDPGLANPINQPGYPRASGAESRSPQPEAAGPAQPGSSPKLKAGTTSLPDVSLHFKIDSTTHEVTVLILDKNTRQVIRTIPSEELAHMRQGELLELFG